jgi:thiol-disulfide isomerase/thioredoxin
MFLFTQSPGLMAQTGSGKGLSSVPDQETSLNKEVTIDGETMLIGQSNREGLRNGIYKSWFDETYNAYVVDGNTLDELKTVKDNLEFLVYMGTWCEDSQREVPALYKILDYLSVGGDKVFQVCVDRTKEVPASLLKIDAVEFVPTIVVLENGKEMGRIVEFPNETLEKDLMNMLLK